MINIGLMMGGAVLGYGLGAASQRLASSFSKKEAKTEALVELSLGGASLAVGAYKVVAGYKGLSQSHASIEALKKTDPKLLEDMFKKFANVPFIRIIGDMPNPEVAIRGLLSRAEKCKTEMVVGGAIVMVAAGVFAHYYRNKETRS